MPPDLGHGVYAAGASVAGDAETGVRGYRLTGDRRFLDPYRAGVAAFPSAQREAVAAAPGTVQRLLTAQQASAQAWLTEFAEPIAGGLPGRPGTAAESAAGKALFDAVRRANAAVADALRDADERATARFRRTSAWSQAGIAALSVFAVGQALFTARRTSRLLLSPLRSLGTVLQRLSEGERTARALAAGPAEVVQLAVTLNETLDSIGRAEADLRSARDDLARRTQYFEQVLDTLGIAVVSGDADGVLAFRNRVARDAADGTTPHHATSTTWPACTRAIRGHPLARALAGEVFEHHEMTLHRPGQPGRAVMVDACPLTVADGTIIGAVASGYDVTVLREREAELTAFAGVVAHDLKAPLASVHGYAELLAAELTPGQQLDLDEIRTLSSRIKQSASRMGQLIDDLLAYATARDKALRPELLDLNALIGQISTDRAATTPLRQRPQIEVDPLPGILADRRHDPSTAGQPHR